MSIASVEGFEDAAGIIAISMTFKIDTDALETNIGLGGMGGRASSFNDLASIRGVRGAASFGDLASDDVGMSLGDDDSEEESSVSVIDAADEGLFLPDSLERTAIMIFAPSLEVRFIIYFYYRILLNTSLF